MIPESSLSPTVYQEMRRIADALMAGERAGHTLEATALTHEVWLRLSRSRNAPDLERGAFLGLAAQAMRRILTEHARARGASKRGAGGRRTTLASQPASTEAGNLALDLDAALTELARLDPELARLVELRFYAGCSTEEVAALLATSPRSVKRRWRFARAWLRRRLEEEAS